MSRHANKSPRRERGARGKQNTGTSARGWRRLSGDLVQVGLQIGIIEVSAMFRVDVVKSDRIDHVEPAQITLVTEIRLVEELAGKEGILKSDRLNTHCSLV